MGYAADSILQFTSFRAVHSHTSRPTSLMNTTPPILRAAVGKGPRAPLPLPVQALHLATFLSPFSLTIGAPSSLRPDANAY